MANKQKNKKPNKSTEHELLIGALLNLIVGLILIIVDKLLD